MMIIICPELYVQSALMSYHWTILLFKVLGHCSNIMRSKNKKKLIVFRIYGWRFGRARSSSPAAIPASEFYGRLLSVRRRRRDILHRKLSRG